MGLSERLLSEAVWLPEQQGKVVLYTFPASAQLQDFTQARLDPVFEHSDYLHKVYQESSEGVQKIELKKVGKGYIYFRGSQNEKQIISIDADMVILDERDRFVEANVPYIDKRTLASNLRWRREASTPTIPGHGIHNSYLNSDQRVWEIQCKSCREWQEIDFFKSIDHNDYSVHCLTCNVLMDRLANGRWHITNPEKSDECHGYKVNGLYNAKRTIEEIVKEYYSALNKSTSDLQQFYNQTLGVPFQIDGQRISFESIDKCKSDYELQSECNQSYAGADVGSVINMEVSIPIGDGHGRVIWAGVVANFFGEYDSVEYIMKKFNVKLLVIDKAPERRKVAELIDKFPGKVFAAEYPTKKFTIDHYIEWDEVTREVKLDRTISLDYLVSDIQNQRIQYPSNIQFVNNYYEQMTSSVRVTVKNERTGEAMAKWVEEKPDHFFHAANYDRIARTKGIIGQALIDYYKSPESSKQSLSAIKRWINFEGQRIF